MNKKENFFWLLFIIISALLFILPIIFIWISKNIEEEKFLINTFYSPIITWIIFFSLTKIDSSENSSISRITWIIFYTFFILEIIYFMFRYL